MVVTQHIAYTKSYCRTLTFGIAFTTSIRGYLCETLLLRFIKDGELFVSAGYSWDGCSGLTVDDRTNLRACLVHDALYQLMRLELLPQRLRKRVDQLFRRMLIDDGMPRLRAWYYYQGVRWFGGSSAQG